MKFGHGYLSWPQIRSAAESVALHRSASNLESKRLPEAAVVIPLLNIDGQASILFEYRSQHLRRHGGEISFPGGYIEQLESPWESAKRECKEELNWHIKDTSYVSSMGLWHNRKSDVLVHSFVVLDEQLHLSCLKTNVEVDHIFTTSLATLYSPGCKVYKHLHRGWPLTPFFKVDENHTIWGFTGYVLDAFLTALSAKAGP
jgi:8-oxo-dGTP pyrophosphatase MutT (NUDIX family)